MLGFNMSGSWKKICISGRIWNFLSVCAGKEGGGGPFFVVVVGWASLGYGNTKPGVGQGSTGGEWIKHHNNQVQYLSSLYSESIMKPFYGGHQWNLDTDFMPGSRFHWALLFPLTQVSGGPIQIQYTALCPE